MRRRDGGELLPAILRIDVDKPFLMWGSAPRPRKPSRGLKKSKSRNNKGGDKKMEWEAEELYKLSKIQPDILEVALKELWQRNPALYKSVIINAYLDEKIK